MNLRKDHYHTETNWFLLNWLSHPDHKHCEQSESGPIVLAIGPQMIPSSAKNSFFFSLDGRGECPVYCIRSAESSILPTSNPLWICLTVTTESKTMHWLLGWLMCCIVPFQIMVAFSFERMKALCDQNTFQQWMSWLPHRWRTQRIAICNANCDTLWII